MENNQAHIQLGKNGVTENFIESLKRIFISHGNVRISVLKNSTRDKKELMEIVDKILEELGKNYTAKVIGFTVIVKKWRKARS